jgi:hypothetical protein
MDARRDDIRPFQRDPPQQEATVVQGVRHGGPQPRRRRPHPPRPEPAGQRPYGWIQIANFILTGLLVIAVAALSYQQPPDRGARSNQ